MALLLLVACADPRTPAAGGDPKASEGSAPLLEASALVLENAEHGPELCVGAVLDSFPPQCGDVPIVGWDWDKVGGEKRVSSTIYGRYHVVGRYDGTSFTLTEAPGPPEPFEGPSVEFETPCPKPHDKPDPSKTSQEDFESAIETAQSSPDFAALWIDAAMVGAPGEEYQDTPNTMLNAAFTGDLALHEAELRKHWGGYLCVSQREHTSAELRAIQSELHTVARDLGMRLLSVGADEYQGFVELTVVFGDEQDQAALDARYGKGLVKLFSRLKPVS